MKLNDRAFTADNQLRIHEALVHVYQAINAGARPLAPRGVTKLVSGKPKTQDEVRKMISLEDFERATAGHEPDPDAWSVRRILHRDPVIAALASKAAATKAAIVYLAKGGFGTDAYNLTRTLFENVVVLYWLLIDDEERREERIDTFILHMEAFLVRYEEVSVERHKQAGTTPDPDFGTTERGREIAAEVFQDKWMHWAWMTNNKGKKTLVRFSQMATELGFEGLYNTEYFTMSAFVHSSPASVFEHSGGPSEILTAGKLFAIKPELFASPAHFADRAIGLSNALMLDLLELLNQRFDLGVRDSLLNIRRLYGDE